MICITKIRGFEKVSLEQFQKDTDLSEECYDSLKLPERATALSAGYDFFLPHSISLAPGEDTVIKTGIKSYMLDDEFLGILPRSGQGFKFFVRLANTKGIIDSDFYNNSDNEGHIAIKIRNEGNKTLILKQGKAFAQAIFQKYLLVDGDSFTGEKRHGGLGHSDKE